MDAQPAKPPQAAQQLVLLEQKIQNLLTKVRINEQNLLNETKHSQIINRNFLEFKKDMREKIDLLLKQMNEQQKAIENLVNAIRDVEERMSKVPMRDELDAMKKITEYRSTMNSGISKDNATDALDEVLEKLKKRKGAN